jgi:pimeloyl-ACP methyl ester carboxylesterase
MMATHVLVHGAWHTGELLEPTAGPMRAKGHDVFPPTLAGNRPGDAKNIGLEEAIQSLVNFFTAHDIQDAILVGHSYGGMVITGAADRVPERLRRLVYWNAFVPNHGESLYDMVPPHYTALFDQIEQANGSVMLPFLIWREAFINDASLELAQRAYEQLNPHPNKTSKEAITLSTNPAADTEILSELHGGHVITSEHALAPETVRKIGSVSLSPKSQ